MQTLLAVQFVWAVAQRLLPYKGVCEDHMASSTHHHMSVYAVPVYVGPRLITCKPFNLSHVRHQSASCSCKKVLRLSLVQNNIVLGVTVRLCVF